MEKIIEEVTLSKLYIKHTSKALEEQQVENLTYAATRTIRWPRILKESMRYFTNKDEMTALWWASDWQEMVKAGKVDSARTDKGKWRLCWW